MDIGKIVATIAKDKKITRKQVLEADANHSTFDMPNLFDADCRGYPSLARVTGLFRYVVKELSLAYSFQIPGPSATVPKEDRIKYESCDRGFYMFKTFCDNIVRRSDTDVELAEKHVIKARLYLKDSLGGDMGGIASLVVVLLLYQNIPNCIKLEIFYEE